MRILYVAKHNSGGGDDEGAIAFALERLGHEVVLCHEDRAKAAGYVYKGRGFDFCLFHKWYDTYSLTTIDFPKVFWYFDLVDWPHDLTLSSRCEARKRWMAEVTPLVDLGFCTDGDWVTRDTTGKLRVLRQGADERVVGFGREQERAHDVLFVGGVKGCGVGRESFVRDLRKRYGGRFNWVERGVYREDLRDLVARSKVVVCPDSPVTDRYWSNRIYVMAGFGACLFHPRVEELVGQNLTLYDNREHLFALLEGHLETDNLQWLEPQRVKVLEMVKEKHLYRHRCEELVRIVKEQLHI